MYKINVDDRMYKEYESSLKPKLLLIANSPLPRDRFEIFDSIQGIEYLSTCFKSKFKSAETHVTYITDNMSKRSFSKDILYTILNTYFINDPKALENLTIAFIGTDALKSFIKEYKTQIDTSDRYLYVNENAHVLKFFSSAICKTNIFIPYIILPDVTDFDSSIIEQLNNTTNAKSITDSPYCCTNEIINKFNTVTELYKNGLIKGFRFNTKLKANSTKGEYFTVYDNFSEKELIFCASDDICKNDTTADRKRWTDAMKVALTSVPVYSDDSNSLMTIINQLPYKEDITVITPDEAVSDTNGGKSFIITGNENGNKSDWYDKWYREVYTNKLQSTLSMHEKKKYGYLDKVKYEWIYDIEVFKYDWLFVAKSLDGKSKVVCWNDGDALWKWIGNKILIGFNNAAYDDVVIRHAMAYPYLDKDAPTVKEYSDNLILGSESPKYYKLADEFKSKGLPPNFLSWDLNFHMPFDIRRNSLKKLTMAVLNKCNYDSSVPFDIQTPLTPEQRKDVEKYCELDVDNTRELFLPDPKDIIAQQTNPKHKMREFARNSYDIRWNLIIEYDMTAKTLINKSSSFAGKLLCGENAKPCLANTYKVVDGKKQYYSIPEMAYQELEGTPVLDFYIKNQTNPDYIHETFECYLGENDEGHTFKFGFGGLHQALINYSSTNLVNMDVASLYPSLLVQYHLMSRGAGARPGSYENVYHTRLAAKKDKSKKLLNLGLKLILNGSIGAMLSEFNPLFDTWANSTICVHGQLFLFILCQRLYNAGFNIVQTNTDGIMIEKRDDVDYMPIADEWQKQTRLVLEFDQIDILQQNNVNNYYCQFTNGDIKSKGFYLSNEKFGKATSKILCNIVTKQSPLTNVLPRDFVIFKKHSVGEIYDGITHKKLEGRSLAFVVGYPNDPRTQSYYSRSRNERSIVKKVDGKPVLDINGNQVMEKVHTESKITGFTDNMLLVDDINTLTMKEINTREYINFALNLLNREEEFGPYYNENFNKTDDPALFQALNPLKDNTFSHPTKSGVVCQNFLFECDYASKAEQEEMIARCKNKLYRVVWSGSKSYHCVVRLDKPVTSLQYKKIWYYLQYKLKFSGADEQSSLPNKYTRVPDQINVKTGNMQTLYLYDKNVLSRDEILAELPRLKNIAQPTKEYKGQVTLKALERHIKRQDWSEGNRFAAVQKLSPVLISQVPYEELLTMIPIKLEKDHLRVIKSKYHYYELQKEQIT